MECGQSDRRATQTYLPFRDRISMVRPTGNRNQKQKDGGARPWSKRWVRILRRVLTVAMLALVGLDRNDLGKLEREFRVPGFASFGA